MITAAALTALTAVLLSRPTSTRRLVALSPVPHPGSHDPATTSRWWASPVLAAVLAGLAVVLVVSPPLGLVPAVGAAVAAHRWVVGAESVEDRRRVDRLNQDLPLAVDLLVACLVAGRPPASALATVAAALRGPLADELRTVAAQLDLGAEPAVVWQVMAGDPALGALGRSLGRATRSGSSVTEALSRCADDARRSRRAGAQARARSVGVKAAAPLGACFLPAFVVVGIVPTIISLLGDTLT